MANYDIPEEPVFQEKIRKLEPTDKASAGSLNEVIEPLVSNEAFLKNELAKTTEYLEAVGTDIHLTDSKEAVLKSLRIIAPESKQGVKPDPMHPQEIEILEQLDIVSSIGRRNLITNTAYIGGKIPPFIRNAGGRYELVELDGETVMRVTTSGQAQSGAYILKTSFTAPPKIGDEFYAMCKIKGGTTLVKDIFGMEGATGKTITTTNLENGWTLVEMFGKHTTAASGSLFFYAAVEDTFYIKEIFVSEDVSGWSPAPEDVTEETKDKLRKYIQRIEISEPLRGIGSVRDEIVQVDGKYGVLRRIAEVDNDTWELSNIAAGQEGARFRCSPTDMHRIRNVKVINTHFTQLEMSSYATEGDFIATEEGSNGRINIRVAGDFSVKTAAEFRAWAKENNMCTIYQLTTPVFEPFSEEVQQRIRELFAYALETWLYTLGSGSKINVQYISVERAFSDVAYTGSAKDVKYKDTNIENTINEINTNLTTVDISNKITKGSSVSSINIMRAKKCGKLITISAIVTFATAPTSGTVLFKIADYIPSSTDSHAMVTYTGGEYLSALAQVRTDGNVTIQANTTHIYNLVKLAYLLD